MEDFTFPTAAARSPPYFIDSPPLWRPPSPSLKLKGKAAEDAGKFNMIHSFQDLESSSIDRRHSEELCGNEEEKMDMLWEDLNDEFSGKRAAQDSDAQITCVQSLKLSKPNEHSILSGRKLRLLVLIKILKKAFLLRRSHPAIKKQSWES